MVGIDQLELVGSYAGILEEEAAGVARGQVELPRHAERQVTEPPARREFRGAAQRARDDLQLDHPVASAPASQREVRSRRPSP